MSQAAALSDSFVGYDERWAIFEHPIQDISMRRVHTEYYYPINSDYGKNGIIQFNLNNASGRYLDINSTKIHLTCNITGKNGEIVRPPLFEHKSKSRRNVDGSEKGDDGQSDSEKNNQIIREVLAPVNNFMGSLFSRCDVHFNGRAVTKADHCYAYISYIKNLMYSSDAEQNTTLQSELFFKDDLSTSGTHTNWQTSDNPSLELRGKLASNSKDFEVSGKIHSDIMGISRYIPSGVNVSIQMFQNPAEFCLISPNNRQGDFKVNIKKASISIRMIEPAPVISLSHEKLLDTNFAKFPYIKYDLKKHVMSAGIYNYVACNSFNDIIPFELLIFLISDSSASGKLDENPYLCRHTSLSHLSVTVDGNEFVNSPLNMTFAKDDSTNSSYAEAFETLSGVNGSDNGTPITYEQFQDGYAIYRFLLDNNHYDNGNVSQLPLSRTGNLKISLRFDEALQKPTTLMVLGRFGGMLKIDKTRNVVDV